MFDPFPFIEAVMANLADAGPKLVYADALDEAGFPTRAAFVRWLGRTNRRPRRDPPSGNALSFYPQRDKWDTTLRTSTLPDRFYYKLWYELPERYVSYVHAADWIQLELAGATVWARLTGGSWLRGPWLRGPWVPDHTPVADLTPHDVDLIRYARGVR